MRLRSILETDGHLVLEGLLSASEILALGAGPGCELVGEARELHTGRRPCQE